MAFIATMRCEENDCDESLQIAGEDFSRWPRLAALVQRALGKKAVRTGIVYPLSAEALTAACQAHHAGLIQAVLYGPKIKIHALAKRHSQSLSGITIVDTADEPRLCAQIAVEDCKPDTSSDLSAPLGALMKGSLHTDELMTAVVAKTSGLRTQRRISHLFVFDAPRYSKIFGVSDAVVNIAPDLDTKMSIVQNAVDAMIRLGITQPKVALLAALEGLNPDIAATVDAAAMIKLAKGSQLSNASVAGAFGFDIAISARAAHIKGVDSQVAGEADLLIAPDINVGNILYKSLVYMGDAACAGVVLGATVPIILTSRADSVVSRIASCALSKLVS
jgi:phosphate acetyltransferase